MVEQQNIHESEKVEKVLSETETDEEFEVGFSKFDLSQSEQQEDDDNMLSKCYVKLQQEIKEEVNINVEEKDLSREAVIIGGGPIGLYLAIQLKQKKFEGVITVYEKRKSYARKHYLKLPSKKDCDPRNFKIEEILKKETILIQDLESELLNIFKTFKNTFIRYYNIDDLESLASLHSNPHIFICDGAHSANRLRLLKSQPIIKPLFKIIQFSYKVKSNKPAELLNMYQQYRIDKYLIELFEYVETTIKNDVVTFRLFVDSFFFDMFSKYTFKSPGKYSDVLSLEDTNAKQIGNAITLFMKYRCYCTKEVVMPETFNLSTFALNCYRSTEFAKRVNNHNYFIIGDSAMGVPFYRSLRNGMIQANNLSNILMGLKEEKKLFSSLGNILSSGSTLKISKDDCVEKYCYSMEQLSEEEFLSARKIHVGVGIKGTAMKISNMVPWQINKMTPKILEEINQIEI